MADQIILKEYGRNMQSLVEYILTIEDRDKRTQYAKAAIELMRLINPNIKDNQEHLSKLWDHLYLMSNFKLDVESPFPMPDKNAIGKKPDVVAYNTNQLYYKHYGKNVELIIEKILAMEEGSKQRESATLYLARLMKRLYQTWNKETVEDNVILQHLKEMSKGRITLLEEDVRKYGLLEFSIKDRPQGGSNSSFGGRDNNGNGPKRNYGDRNGDRNGGSNKFNNKKRDNNFKYKK
ncbi:MAG: DUF4290 domain-containing protein [Cytophagaceae bacterium]|nr:DUF4290 domain-containing protein [Cytophagaceae bacterium]